MKYSYRLYLTVLLFTPLALGARSLWSRSVMECLCVTALLLLSVATVRKRTDYYTVPGFIPLLLLLGYMLFQVIPLPSEFVRFISPETFRIYNSTNSITGPLSFIPVSVHPKSTIMEFFRFSAYACIYILTIQLLADKHRLKKTVFVIVVFAGMIAVYALIERFFSNGKIYWFVPLPPGNSHIGPYVYQNHYAGFMELVFPVMFAVFYYYKPAIRYTGFRETIVDILSLDKSNIHILLGFFALLSATSVFVSLSRGGIISFSLSMILFMSLLLLHSGSGRNELLFILFVFLLIFSVGWFGWDMIVAKFDRMITSDGMITDGRFMIWDKCKPVIRDFLITGTGFGTFETIFPAYLTTPLFGDKVVDHAHNDYIELAVTGGGIGLFLAGWFVFSVFKAVFSMLVKRQDSYSVCLSLGAVAGIASILFHSVSDFNFYSGANGLYFFFICGLAVSASSTRTKTKRNESYLTKKTIRFPRLVPASVAILVITGMVFNIGCIRGAVNYSMIKETGLTGLISPEELAVLERSASVSVKSDPLNGDYHLAAAVVADFQNQNTLSLYHYEKAISLDPVNGEIAQRFGKYLLRNGETAKAEILLEAGVRNNPADAERYKHYAAFMFYKKNTGQGIRHLRKALELDQSKRNILECIAIMVHYRLSDDGMIQAMPQRVIPRYALADHFKNQGRLDIAEKIELSALECIGNEPRVSVHMFSRIYIKMVKKGDYDGALAIIEKAVKKLPETLSLRITAGDIYKKLGVIYRAEEEYRKALVISPGNTIATERLSTL